MKNYTKTIVSAIQNWTIGKIKNSTADWNQNDSNATDYVKNRPFYTGDPIKNTILETQIATIDEDGGRVELNSDILFKVGETYIVNFNGTEYECVAWVRGDQYCIGNGDVYGGTGMGGQEPFSFDSYESGSIYINTANAGTHTFSINTIQQKIIKIPEKYLPATAGKKVENTEYNIDDDIVVADIGAEIFNNYIDNIAIGNYSHAEGANSTAEGEVSHAEGTYTHALGNYSHAEGYGTIASGNVSHAEGDHTIASGRMSHAEGHNAAASGEGSHAEGLGNIASGKASHAEGYGAIASGEASHAEGYQTVACGDYSHAEGCGKTTQIRITGAANSLTYTISKNIDTIKVGNVIRYDRTVATVTAIDETTSTITVNCTLKENHDLNSARAYNYCPAFGDYSHTEGYWTAAYGNYSHAEGLNTIASSDYQHVQGKYNIEDANSVYQHIVGNGASDTKRSNAHTLDRDGNAWFQGDVYVGSTSGKNKDEGSKKLVTADDVNELLASLITVEDIDEICGASEPAA